MKLKRCQVICLTAESKLSVLPCTSDKNKIVNNVKLLLEKGSFIYQKNLQNFKSMFQGMGEEKQNLEFRWFSPRKTQFFTDRKIAHSTFKSDLHELARTSKDPVLQTGFYHKYSSGQQ